MQDRMGDLRRLAAGRSSTLGSRCRVISVIFDPHRFDVETQLGIVDDAARDFMREPLRALDNLKAKITAVAETLQSITALQHRVAAATTPGEESECSVELTRLLAEGNYLVLSIKRGLDDLREENAQFVLNNANSSEARMRENLHAAVARKFKAVLKKYQAVQLDYKKGVNDRVKRQLKIAFPDATEEEVSQVSTNPEVAAGAIQQRLAGQQPHELMRTALSGIQEKYNDIQKLEQSAVELHQMFVDLATVVDAQGEMLDQIEFAVNNAEDYTQKAEKELIQSRKRQRRARKRTCWLTSCVIVLGLVVAMPILVQITR